MSAGFRTPGACHTDLDSGDNTISGFIMNKKPKENPNKDTFSINCSGCKKKSIESAALTVMLAEGKAETKLSFAKRYLMI